MLVDGEHYVAGLLARLSHVRLASAIGAQYGVEVQQMDVYTAFLGAPLEEIYMIPPQGYASGAAGGDKRKVLQLKKSQYS